MVKGLEAVVLNSPNAKKLAEFYDKVVGLEISEEYEIGEGQNAYSMKTTTGSGIFINDHSDLKGESKDPNRTLLNLEVDDLEKEVARLNKEDVKLVTDIFHMQGYGLVATFEDIDGNYFQLVQVKES